MICIKTLNNNGKTEKYSILKSNYKKKSKKKIAINPLTDWLYPLLNNLNVQKDF